MFQKPRLGVAYYPEDWPADEIPNDIRKMKELGISVIRVAEFAWSRLEPNEGEYDFAWLDEVINQFGEAGIDTILGTVSATPPQWFLRKYPDSVMEMENGRTYNSGGRRYCCENHPGYRQTCARITEEMAKHFGHNPYLIGWQVDNEIYPLWKGCFCEHCRQGFHSFLREKYGNIGAVNAAWDTNLFSQHYDDFEDIPMPRDAWSNPHLVMEWQNYKNDSMISFVHMQAEILHKYSDAPVGTDLMCVPMMSFTDMYRPMEVVMCNHYNDPGNLEDAVFWFDHFRTLKERPFWNTETAVNWNGAVSIGQSVKPEGFCRANSWLPVAAGAELNMYWLWRAHWAGHEMMHGAVLDTCGKPSHVIGELRQTASDFDRAGDFIKGTRPVSEAALIYSPLSSCMSQAQPIVDGFSYMDMIQRFHKSCVDAGVNPDVIDPSKDISGYRMIITPMLMTMEEGEIGKRLEQWVRSGGTWIVGPFSDIRDTAGAKYRDRHFGMLESMTGVEWLYGIPDREHRLKLVDADGQPMDEELWVDVFGEADGVQSAARSDGNSGLSVDVTVADGYSTLIGKTVSFTKKIGEGRVVVLGTFPSREQLAGIIRRVAKSAQAVTGYSETGTLLVRRKGIAGEGVAAVEMKGMTDHLCFPDKMVDLLTGEVAEAGSKITMPPYGVRVMKKLL